VLALAVTSAVSVILIIIAKWQRLYGKYGDVATAILIAWAIALPFVLPAPIRSGPADLWRSTAAGVLIVLAALANLAIAHRLRWNLQRLKDLGASSLAHSWRTFGLMAVMAPICEEYMFRGFLMHALLGYGAVIAVSVTTIVYVAAHLDWSSIPHLVIAGLLFAMLALATGGLLAPIIAHAVAGLLGFAVLFRFGPQVGLVQREAAAAR
jgi:membrane protease YdiL (CAAX protease family)